MGVLYILDEPSIGLHQRDNRRLLSALTQLRDLGNTVLVVEHDEETIRTADYVIDMGPGAGEHGGHVVAAGPPEAILACEASLTGQYLSGKKEIPVPPRRRRSNGNALADHRVPGQQPEGHRRDDPAGGHHVRHGRVRVREVDPHPGHPVPGAGPEAHGIAGSGRGNTGPSRGWRAWTR